MMRSRPRSLRLAVRAVAGAAVILAALTGGCSGARRSGATQGAPTNVSALGGDGQIVVTFSAPADALPVTLAAYVATCTGGGATFTARGAASPLTVSGVRNGVSYSCTVASTGAGASASAAVSATPGAATAGFRGSAILGSPTPESIRLNIYAADQSGQVYAAYGAAPGAYSRVAGPISLQAGTPAELTLDGLSGNSRYFYRLYYSTGSGAAFGAGDEHAFQTPRAPGTPFVFDIQGDSHPERERTEFNGELYTRTLTLAAADHPDFYMTSGDDFSVDTLDAATITRAQVTNRYAIQRPYLGIVGRDSPVFLVNGNHEQAARYLLNGTADNVAVWAQTARNSFYSEPAPNSYYTGNTENVPFIGLLRNYYAWTWGDALFVVIDPYWASPGPVDNVFGGGPKASRDWDITHGDAQYRWLKSTLENSKAKYKFVFAHHVLGTGRGGVEVARLFEWGGQNQNGTNGFAAERPTWSLPIHQLMAANHVTIFFQGHDHIWVRQSLDGVIYQSLPEPANPNYALLNGDAYLTGDKFPGSGYTRVTVGPSNVTVEYVRSYLPADEGPGKHTGDVSFRYTVPAS